MTERQSDDVVEILRRRLGPRHPGPMAEGRDDMARALRDELGLGAAEAEALLREQIDAGHLRYVISDERDPEAGRTAQRDERSDREARGGDDPALGAAPGVSIVPEADDPQGRAGGPRPAAVLPVAGAGSGSAGPAPIAVAAAPDTAEGQGYWDIGAGTVGVVPSTTRKGQVEPKGT